VDDYKKLWSSIGSAGVVDPADVANVVTSGSIAQLGPAIGGVVGVGGTASSEAEMQARVATGAPGLPRYQKQAVIRYSVVPVEGLVGGPSGTPLELIYPVVIRLRMRPGQGSVTANLYEVDIDTGAESLIAQCFADPTLPPPPPQEWGVNSFGVLFDGVFDFVNKAYYVAVTLVATLAFSEPLTYPPAVSVIQLVNATAAKALGLS
jgi:hypothetical protein